MHPVSAAGVSAQRGFTALEALVVVAILGIMLAVGIPGMRGWLGATTTTGAAQFYAEGYRLARSQALANNSRSRLVFTENEQSGQFDWQVDVCFPVAADTCGVDSERWSSVDEPAPGPSEGDIATSSILRSAAALPHTTALGVTPDSEARSVYFTELGWVDGGKPALMRLDLGPGSADAEEAFTPSAVVLTLAGAVITCRPDLDDARKCP